MRLLNLLFGICVIGGFFNSCRSDKPEVKPLDKIDVKSSEGVFVLDEGNFTWGNASIEFYTPATNKVSYNIFEATNNRTLGDVAQSMSIYKGKAYIVINNSGKIEVVNPATLTSLGTVSGLMSPRYFVGISDSKAYVSDYKSNSISVINLSSLEVEKKISCPGWTEEMILVGDKVFVTNIRKEYVYLVNTKTDIIEDSVKVGDGPNSIRQDKNGKVWILCGGDNNDKPVLVKVNPETKQIELSIPFNTSNSPWRLKINGAGDRLYYLNDGVFEFPITNSSLNSNPLISQYGMLFYGLGVDPLSGDIYVSDAIDYVQHGKVYRYHLDGSLISSFDVGIIPGEFCFN